MMVVMVIVKGWMMVVVKVIMVMMVMDIVMVEVNCSKNSLLFFSDFWVVIVIVNYNYKILHMVLNIELTMTIIVSLPHLENMMQVIVFTLP